MNEDFIQYLWKHKKFRLTDLKTTNQEEIVLLHVGYHNTDNSGPDFFNSQMIIDNQKWAGNVEIHTKASDWYIHNHENNEAYDNVILHVVWDDDIEIYRKDNSLIPTLQIKKYVDENLLARYTTFFENDLKKWIECENQLPDVSEFVLANWQERLYIERLEQKSDLIKNLLKNSSNDWEAVLYKLLSKNFGLKINSDSFLSLAESVNFSIIRKCNDNVTALESLFFGQSGMLKNDFEEEYPKILKEQYAFLKNKFKLENQGVVPFLFFRLRPSNFPTIRLAQFAGLYAKNKKLFTEIIKCNTLEDFYRIFKIETSPYWDNHYTFHKESSIRKKSLSKSFINLILINTIIPIKFHYAKTLGKDVNDEILSLLSLLPPEKNQILEKFSNLNVVIKDALQAQAMIQLKNNYCNQKACLKCAVGNYLLNGTRIMKKYN